MPSLLPRLRALRQALAASGSRNSAAARWASSAAAWSSSSAATPGAPSDSLPPTSSSSSPPAMEVFDRPRKWAQRDRAAAMRLWPASSSHDHDADDPLVAAVAGRLCDRLSDCVATFTTVVVLPGAGADAVFSRLRAGGRSGIERVVRIESSPGALRLARALHERRVARDGAAAWPRAHFVLADEEFLPLAPGSVDLVVSCLGLHWANDLPVRVMVFLVFLFRERSPRDPPKLGKARRAAQSRDPRPRVRLHERDRKKYVLRVRCARIALLSPRFGGGPPPVAGLGKAQRCEPLALRAPSRAGRVLRASFFDSRPLYGSAVIYPIGWRLGSLSQATP